MFRVPTTNLVRRTTLATLPRAAARASSTQALSNPTLKNIEKRWEGMPLQEQAELWMALRDRMKESWHDLTLQEKKAGKLSRQWLSCIYLSEIHRRSLRVPSG
jgi:cytochrome c oxidase subunit 4